MGEKLCFSYDLEELAVQPSTNYSHLLGGLVEYKSELVAIAGYSYHVEVLQDEWQPFLDNIGDVINSFTTLVYADEIYVFGGYSILAQDYVTRVWKFNGVTWNVVGYTAVPRSNYRTVLVNDVAFTAGGFGEKNNEKWTFDKGESRT